MYYGNPIKIICTTLLNDGTFRFHRLSVVTSARLHKPDFVFRFYVYGSTFDNPPGYFFYLHVEQFLALYALMGFGGFWGVFGDYWSAFCLFRTL
jgi:hypothetical protein